MQPPRLPPCVFLELINGWNNEEGPATFKRGRNNPSGHNEFQKFSSAKCWPCHASIAARTKFLEPQWQPYKDENLKSWTTNLNKSESVWCNPELQSITDYGSIFKDSMSQNQTASLEPNATRYKWNNRSKQNPQPQTWPSQGHPVIFKAMGGFEHELYSWVIVYPLHLA